MAHRCPHEFYRHYYEFYGPHLDATLPFGSSTDSSMMYAYEDRMCNVKLLTGGSGGGDHGRNSGLVSVEHAPPPQLPPAGTDQVPSSSSLTAGESTSVSSSMLISQTGMHPCTNPLLEDAPQIHILECCPQSNNPRGLHGTPELESRDSSYWDDDQFPSPPVPSSIAFKSLGLYEYSMGLKITSGTVTITKDESTNMIGISIGGGAPNCPCLYIVQVFDNTPAAREGTLQSGDEITGVNNVSVKGKTKVEVAKMIQAIKGEVTIQYNKLHAEASQGKSLDIILKKVKHRLVENMSSTTADALGLSRAILCNDSLVKKLAELQRTEVMYRGMVEHTQRLLRAYLELLRVVKVFGETFAQIGVREPQPRASLAFTQFADYHRAIEKRGVEMVKQLKPILSDLGTYLYKAIPDTKLTIGKYADAKFEYLSFCLKVKEMDDEEFNYASIQEPLYRVETGNYEYRLVLRCRQEARARFAQLRSDVQVKLELLDNKHVQDVAAQLQKLSKGLAEFYEEIHRLSKENENLFPVEVDLTDTAFIYDSTMEILPPDENTDENE